MLLLRTMAVTTEQLITSGYEARREGRPEEAKRRFSRALAEYRNNADEAARARALIGLGQIERDLGNLAAALSCYREAADVYRLLPAPLKLAHTLRHIGDMLRDGNEMEEGRPFYEEALAVYREHEERLDLDLANMLRGFALLESQTGSAERAKAFFAEAKQLYEAAGAQLGIDMQPGIEECERHLKALETKDS